MFRKPVGDVPSATAILDRFLHHAEVIAIAGKSYRLRGRALAGSSDKQAEQPKRRFPAPVPASDPWPTTQSATNSIVAKKR